MPKILVSLTDQGEQEEVCSALRLKKHNVSVLPDGLPADSPKAAAEALLETKVNVAIVDYVADDAFSVKMLQEVTEHATAPRVVFLLSEDAPVSHILMAVNEGASAILQRPLNLDALANYVDRAVNGPARFRYELTKENTRAIEISDMEREAKAMKVQLAAYRKLISYLMSTPAAGQNRIALIVSDSAYQRDSLKKLLEDHGFLVHTAANPAEGLQKALDEKPRVVISDLEMEGQNGVEFCHELKIAHKFMPCYFVICTANSEKIEQVMAPGNGVDACVIKPSNESGNQELVASAAMGLLL